MGANIIPPGVYPVFPAALARQLREPAVATALERVLTANVAAFADVVRALIGRMEPCCATPQLYENAHEIRGLAGNAGLTATARIAGELCRYLDTAADAPETTILQLHIEALGHTARAGDGDLSEAVARELAELVSKKLAVLKIPETMRCDAAA